MPSLREVTEINIDCSTNSLPRCSGLLEPARGITLRIADVEEVEDNALVRQPAPGASPVAE